MDLFGTRWRIVERREYPRSKDLSTSWYVEHKFLGLFWTNCCEEDYAMCVMDRFDTLSEATKRLLAKLGDKKFYKNMKAGKIEIIRLPPVEFGVRLVKEIDPRAMHYVVKSGHYEDNGILFVVHENVTQMCSSASEALIQADIKGFKIDNRQQFDPKCTAKDRDDGVLMI